MNTKICLNSTYFSFQNIFYKQTEGLAMGSSISATVANLVMEHIQNFLIPQLPFPLPFFKRYVDDIITCIIKRILYLY